MSHSLIAQDLSKRFKSRQVVKQVSFKVNSGQVVGLLGPNGAGKTTCFYMVVGLIACNTGHVFLNDEDITQLPMHLRAQKGIGYLPQEASVFRKLSVEQNILAILETRTDLDKQKKSQHLENLLKEFNLNHIKNNLGISLSGGERRRVEIARALALSPKFILLDEPFAGVDPISIQEIKQQIKYLAQRDIGILITDHNVRDTLAICDNATIISEGTVIAMGGAQEILSNQKVRDVYLGEEFTL
ncbi:LPS export ABC transporter ATP-binding protein [Candidatus Berkiella cookevillensis]|uniref:Lipopolysaccharide export system ATP-binding protein LptB n=1 Tax=Candidatus Berkiella cookevillensis TaxID=437022 RepID=A0A0Q9YBT5_9GAMM|nr:LPS export ABC transporter ATP-binding protein [Candidatus Berkiella cookevillensis]MCS5709236.1 LPS export ABC transporter ATP-binding protein [Candidatus Berkiella cookevillensis]